MELALYSHYDTYLLPFLSFNFTLLGFKQK